ncbi:uncharacterized protein LOC134326068 isoform X2 [Trichomycterus rosablanca]|uniref:uncharacterized protein LOC134326068 isoform X2 n=1 Tax=Trichomycterus rosablanca TaxID=2290929 RepID=UPI002F35B8EC
MNLPLRDETIEILKNIEDLKNIEFGHDYPHHGLFLLHFLASHISIDLSEGILLHFDPERQDYGFQYYNNTRIDGNTFLHPDDPQDRVYYTLGDLSSEAVRTKLPPYVTQEFYNAYESPKRDLDRMVLEMQKGSSRKADRVYITQVVIHQQGLQYNQNKTFEISPKLIKQVQALQKPLNLLQALELLSTDNLNASKGSSDDPRLALPSDQFLNYLKYSEKHLKNIFEEPSLRWLLILAGYDLDGRFKVHEKIWSCSKDESFQREQTTGNQKVHLCEGPAKIEVKSTENGYARLTWSGIPKNILDLKPYLVLFKSDSSNDLETFESLQEKTSGSVDTTMALNHGLHPRLVTYNFANKYGFLGIRYSVIWRGPQFDEANRAIPVDITGYNASLQLYTRNGYACARLYIKNSFTDWENEFRYSWVGFYTSDQDPNHKHQHYQWVSKFDKVDNKSDDHLIYEYESSLSIGPGVQARFLYSSQTVYTRLSLRWSSVAVKARTVPWENMYK